MKTVLRMLPYLASLASAFYLLPLLVQDTGSGMFVLLSVLPILTLVAGILYGMHHGLHPLFAILAGMLFLPAVFVFFNPSARFFSLIYAAIALLGNAGGMLITRSGAER